MTGVLTPASTTPVPKRIRAPAIIAITIGTGSQAATRRIKPVRPSASTSTPAAKKAPTISLNSKSAKAPTTSTAPGMLQAPVIGIL